MLDGLGPRTVTLACEAGHQQQVEVTQVTIAHTAHTAVGVNFDCAECHTNVLIKMPSTALSLLSAFGVAPSPTALPGDFEPSAISDHRRAYSRQLLSALPATESRQATDR